MIREEAIKARDLSCRVFIDSGMTSPPNSEQIAEWTVAALQSEECMAS